MNKLVICMIGIFIVSLGAGCADARIGNTEYGEAKDFTAPDINGKAVTLSNYKGKIIFLNFFSTWCPPCRMEMPDFNALSKEYSKEVEVIAVAVGRESIERVKSFVKDNNLGFTVIMDDGNISGLYGPMPGIPVTVVIDKDFNIQRRYIGMRPKEVFLQDVDCNRKCDKKR
ncbi:MAG: TlpA family protein disulfide reductase [Candidatus Atribacteria bacterium]|nr:TlpA family protein disulfide reductase [Candidatus Atribacteria bacterium]